MKAKVLFAGQFDLSGFEIFRVYLEPNYDQAEKDCEMLQKVSFDKTIHLTEVELFTTNKPKNENE